MAFSSSLPSKPQVTNKSLQDHFLMSTLPRKGGSSTLSRLFSFIKRSKEIPVPPVQKKKKMKSWNLVSSERRRNKDKDASSSALPLFGCCTSTSHDAFDPEFKSGPLLLPDSNPSPVLVSSSGRDANDVPLNLGIGFGLIYLTLACKNELNKMVEQKTRMEALIKDAKTVITAKDVGISNLSQSNDDLSFSVSRLPMVGSTSYMSNTNSVALYSSLGETDNGQERDEYFEIGFDHEREEGAAGVDHLEAELETELERLQLNLDAEESFRDELQQKQERSF